MLGDRIRGFQHLGIPAHDIKKFRAWFENTLGAELVAEEIIPTDTEGDNVMIDFLSLGDLILELYQLPEEENERMRKRTTGSIDHFAVNVLDADETYKRLLREGVAIDSSTSKGPVFAENIGDYGSKFVNIVGPNKIKVELSQEIGLSPKPRAKEIWGLKHIGIPTETIDDSLVFFKKLGFEVALETNIGDTEIVMMEKGNLVLEFYSVKSPMQEGIIDHIALDVDDIHKAFEDAQAMKLQVVEGRPIQLPCWENGVIFFNILGPDNVKIELNQKL